MLDFKRRLAEYYIHANHQAKRRKSAWNLILIPFCFGAAVAIGFVLFRLVWIFHTLFYPEHELREFWQRGISIGSFFPSFLMVFSIVPGAAGAGFIVGNSLGWLIRPARCTFETEAKGYSGTTSREAMGGLFKFTIWALPIGLLVALAAAYFLKSLS